MQNKCKWIYSNWYFGSCDTSCMYNRTTA